MAWIFAYSILGRLLLMTYRCFNISQFVELVCFFSSNIPLTVAAEIRRGRIGREIKVEVRELFRRLGHGS